MRRGFAIVWSLLALVGLLLVSPRPAHACSCIVPGSPQEEMARASAVLAGRVLQIDTAAGAVLSTADPIRVTMQVEKVWKGSADATQVLVTSRDSASCGYSFVEGEEYLVYASVQDGALQVSLCSRTAPLANAGEDLTALGPGMAVQPDAPAADPGGLSTGLLVAIAAVALLLVLAVSLLLARSVRRRAA